MNNINNSISMNNNSNTFLFLKKHKHPQKLYGYSSLSFACRGHISRPPSGYQKPHVVPKRLAVFYTYVHELNAFPSTTKNLVHTMVILVTFWDTPERVPKTSLFTIS